MRRMMFILGGVMAALMLLSAACGGDDSTSTVTPGTKTAAPATKTAAATATPSAAEGTPISAAQLATYLQDIKQVLQNSIAKAQAGDVQGTRDAEGEGDTAMEAIIKSVRPLDPSLADQIEQLELDYEKQADADNTDLSVIIADMQKALPLLDQAGVKLNLGSASASPAAAQGTPISSAQLSAYFTSLRQVMNNTIAKAQAGDVQGTRDAEGEGDTPMEAIIKSLRAANSPLGDQLERLELDYEAQADATNTDVTVIATDAKAVLPLLDQAATLLHVQ